MDGSASIRGFALAGAARPGPRHVRMTPSTSWTASTADQKRLAPKYFYDERGSQLFDQICDLPEYYPTRTELKLMRMHMHEVADLVGPRASVIEFGAGSSVKIRVLLDHLIDPVAYVPVDISAEYLVRQADDLAERLPRDRRDAGVRGLHAAVHVAGAPGAAAPQPHLLPGLDDRQFLSLPSARAARGHGLRGEAGRRAADRRGSSQGSRAACARRTTTKRASLRSST